MPEKTVIIIAGPTAVGKTSAAIELALKYKTEIISADSRQCYQELNIGVARPSSKELEQVPHHFIASHSIHHKITAAYYENYALEKTADLFEDHDTIIMVGGTGLYLKAFCEGMDEIPEVSEETRNEIIFQYQQNGMEWLQEEVKKLDPFFFDSGENKNPHRLMRALEVFKTTGQSILSFRKKKKQHRDFRILKYALELPREKLYENINNRVDRMIELGLEEEVRSLIPYQHLNALQTVGYKELFDYFSGKISREEAISEIKKNTRHYAKRQMTWFRKDSEYIWHRPDDQLEL